ncbi:crosslink repair DNA glycosylase YcaQ family protein [Ruegeria sp. 2205SS24-7]|uniref:winged helix-turn-helix domain-containing protein n=1 Tax=Ruegeria discodermiae TaxID=3064389 RepID=UPI00274192A1|nr:crosslink repair DNA glycosylase YcaQ family protein [Ruegeria sp. 2205SS24-7]MDP5219573.1 crosslink repair DNA glycosylase YcaQ family protein [Ruegeria sp. 2205SS24-7]
MAVRRLDNRTARHVFLDRHGLADTPAGPGKGADLSALIQRLGFVQVDSINTVARAHDMILYARRPAYRPAHLKRLYERDRQLFEHWTHDAAVIPMDFYPQWHLKFRRDAEALKSRWQAARREGYEQQFQEVLSHIRDHGPACSSDVGKDERKGSGGWWDWHPSKTALEYLWRSGVLTVIGRDGFRKRYDLTERVIEAHLCPGAMECDEAATVDWLCNAALDRLGFATSGELAAFWDIATPAEAKAWCARAEQAGDIETVEIECADGALRRVFARPGTGVAAGDALPGRLRILSPFDPALRDRKRAERLFGFHYRIEVFVPAAKRKYGYYVFPLLEGNRLVGRLDMKAARERGTLELRALWPETGIRWTKGRMRKLEAELNRICRFADLDRVVFHDNWLREV